MDNPNTIVIGLCGGIGSGKSTVAASLAARGYLVHDFDRLVRAQLAEPEVIRMLSEWWGDEVLGENGQLDRAAIAARVFADEEERKRLEALLHPRVWMTRPQAIAAAEAAGAPGMVFDAPLLFEAGLDRECDVILFVDTPRDQRLRRVIARGWDADELARREAAQWPLDRKKRASTHVLRNDGDQLTLDSRVADLCGTLRRSTP